MLFFMMSSWYASSGDALKDDDDHDSYVQTKKKESHSLSGLETPSNRRSTISL